MYPHCHDLLSLDVPQDRAGDRKIVACAVAVQYQSLLMS